MKQTEIQGSVGAQFMPAGNAAEAAPATGAATLPPPLARSPVTLTASPGTGAAVERDGCVTSAGLNVRDRPGREGAVVDWLRNGKCYPFDGGTAYASPLGLAGVVGQDGGRLWGAAQYIELKGDINALLRVK